MPSLSDLVFCLQKIKAPLFSDCCFKTYFKVNKIKVLGVNNFEPHRLLASHHKTVITRQSLKSFSAGIFSKTFYLSLNRLSQNAALVMPPSLTLSYRLKICSGLTPSMPTYAWDPTLMNLISDLGGYINGFTFNRKNSAYYGLY